MRRNALWQLLSHVSRLPVTAICSVICRAVYNDGTSFAKCTSANDGETRSTKRFGEVSFFRCERCELRCRELSDAIIRSIALLSGHGVDFLQGCPRDTADDPLENGRPRGVATFESSR